jgi:hypothetical protein
MILLLGSMEDNPPETLNAVQIEGKDYIFLLRPRTNYESCFGSLISADFAAFSNLE